MRDASIIAELRAALRRNGVWGFQAERLMREWTDHVREHVAQRVEKGLPPEAAQDAAWKALGIPDVLAAKAGSELVRASWLGRHPWLAGLTLPTFAWFALLVAILFAPGWIGSLFWEGEALERSHPAAVLAWMGCWQAIFNWLPWLLSIAWLARIAVRMPGGWKLFWITAVVITVCSTSIFMKIRPPLHGPGSGVLMINFYLSGILGVVVNAFGYLLGYGREFRSWSDWARYTAPSWIQTVILLLGILTFHFKARARSGAAGAVLCNEIKTPSGIDFNG